MTPPTKAANTVANPNSRNTTRLNQILAVEKGVKQRAHRDLSDAYHQIQRTTQLSGISRTYRPLADDGEQFPPESTRVQVKVPQVLEDVAAVLTRYLDVSLTKDVANQEARNSVVVGGETLIEDAPVTFLLTLEKQLIELRTFLSALPVLDVAEDWSWNENAEAYVTPAVETAKAKKIPRNHVLAEATKDHPAQVQIFNEDVVVGYWSTVKFSGAVPGWRRTLLVDRVQMLLDAVRFAREEANIIEVSDRRAGAALFSYLLRE